MTLIHGEDCTAQRPESYAVEHQGGRAQVERCLTCGGQTTEWLSPPLLPPGGSGQR